MSSISKTKGNIGEAIIIAEFVKRGIQVSIPFGDNARYDLIAEFGGKLNKIQIKYCSIISENNAAICHSSSSKNHTTNKVMSDYKNDVDYIAFYIAPWNRCCLVPIQECKGKTFSIRNEDTKNNQQSNTHMIKDYDFDKILNNDLVAQLVEHCTSTVDDAENS